MFRLTRGREVLDGELTHELWDENDIGNILILIVIIKCYEG